MFAELRPVGDSKKSVLSLPTEELSYCSFARRARASYRCVTKSESQALSCSAEADLEVSEVSVSQLYM